MNNESSRANTWINYFYYYNSQATKNEYRF